MAARSISAISISFGLVSIPVKLFAATESARAISFNMLHKCGSRLKQQYVCESEGVVVPREDMVKGYEFSKDQYVIFTPAELKVLEETGTQTAEISAFVPVQAVDPIFYDKPYFLAPDKGGAKSYALLARALRDTGRAALGRWAVRGKAYIIMIRPMSDGLVMQQLLFGRDVRLISDLDLPQTEVKDAELKLAKMLIDQQSSDSFDPAAFPDEVTARVEAAIEEKVRGKEISVVDAPRATGDVIDLMEALRASLENRKSKPAAGMKPRAIASKPAVAAKELEEARKGPKRAPVDARTLVAVPSGRTVRKKA